MCIFAAEIKTNEKTMKRILFYLAFMCCALCMQAVENYPYRSDYLWVTVPDHADWLYEVGQKATVEVQFYLYGMPRDGVVEWEVGTDLLPSDQKGTLTLKNGRGKISMGTAKKPCFRDLRLKMKLDGKTYEHHVKVGFSADKIQPFTKEPKDFWTFWQDNVKEAEKYPVNFTKEYVKEMSSAKVDAYRLKIDLDKDHHAFYAYLLMPKGAKAGSCPVVLTPPGAGVKPIRDATTRRFYPENGFIRMALDIHGLNPTLSEEVFAEIRAAFDNKGNAYLRQGLEDRNLYYMKHVYLGLVRCIDILTQLPEWDGKNVIMQGGSQGGALALIGTALDPRVTLCVANHPALSDMAAGSADLTSGYPHFKKESGAYSEACMKTLPYYDVVNFARHIQVPVYMTWGYNDNTCPPTTSYAVWNVLTSPKESLLTPVNEHWTSDATDRGQMEWMRKHLK